MYMFHYRSRNGLGETFELSYGINKFQHLSKNNNELKIIIKYLRKIDRSTK